MGCDDWLLLLDLAHRFRVQLLPGSSVLIRIHPGRSMNDFRAISRSREVATRRILAGDLLHLELDDGCRTLLVAGTHQLTASHWYAAGEMRLARASMREVRRTLGLGRGLRWTARLWCQSWLGPVGVRLVGWVRDSLVWR